MASLGCPSRSALALTRISPRPGSIPSSIPTISATSVFSSHGHPAAFSTSAPCQKRCSNRRYRLSALRGTGLGNQTLSVTLADLPMPVYDPTKRTKPVTSPSHGLWGFFNPQRTVLATPTQDAEHGRGWHAEEIRRKSWGDLHHLWWTCMRERNRLRTEKHSRKRLEAGFGDFESAEREKQVVKTMRTVRAILLERWYAWNDAFELSKTCPEIAYSTDPNGQLKVTYTPLEDPNNVDLSGLDPENREAYLLEQSVQQETLSQSPAGTETKNNAATR